MITTATKKGPRSYQEDRFVVVEHGDGVLLAVADGHGGVDVAKYVANHLKETWEACYDDMAQTPLAEWGIVMQALKHTVQNLHAETQWLSAGSTLSIAFIPAHKKTAYIAVLGDSPVIVRKPNGELHISPEHNVRTNAAECDAAVERGAFIHCGYMSARYSGPGIQMTRVLGDAELDSIINREPEIYSVSLGSFLLVGSDGLFDPTHRTSVAEQAAHLAECIFDGKDAKGIVDATEPAHDNVTAILWTRDSRTTEQRLIEDYGIPQNAIKMATYPPLSESF